jgi:hypothetical protein
MSTLSSRKQMKAKKEGKWLVRKIKEIVDSERGEEKTGVASDSRTGVDGEEEESASPQDGRK